MKNICLISDLHDWHSKQIESALKLKGYTVIICKFADIKIEILKSKKLILINEKVINIHAVWVRFIGQGSLEEITFKLSVLHLFNDMSIYVHNSPSVIEKTVDKFRTSSILKINKINTPSTWIFLKKKEFLKKAKKLIQQKYTLLCKPLFGSQGNGIVILKSLDDLDNFRSLNRVYYLQKFIGNSKKKKFSDVRVLVSNNKIVSSIKRTSKDIITNVSKGAKIEKIKINNNLFEQCINVSKLLNLGYGGMDIKIHQGNFFFLEINSIPSWRGVQSVEKMNIASILVDDFIRIVEKYKK